MAVFLTVADLQVFKPDLEQTKAQAMIDDATATAVVIAPCLKTTEDPDVIAAAKSDIRRAILRWADAGSGALTQRGTTTGPFSHQESIDTRHAWSGLYRPDEIERLQGLCAAATSRRKAFTINPTPVYPEGT